MHALSGELLACPQSCRPTNSYRLSANMAVATLSTGMVGPIMSLSFWDSFAVIITINLFTCAIPAWTATFGLTGLRMTTFS